MYILAMICHELTWLAMIFAMSCHDLPCPSHSKCHEILSATKWALFHANSWSITVVPNLPAWCHSVLGWQICRAAGKPSFWTWACWKQKHIIPVKQAHSPRHCWLSVMFPGKQSHAFFSQKDNLFSPFKLIVLRIQTHFFPHPNLILLEI